jgi:hypothetical protein
MGLLSWLDPTRDWPVVKGPAPDLDGKTLQLDVLPFGAPIESARFLGKPNQIEWNSRSKQDFELFYTDKRLRLRFREGKLSDVAYLVGNGAQPKAPDGDLLTSSADRDEIVKRFGEPDPGGSDETCLQVFHRNGVISDFYLDDNGRLKEWILYPDD